LTLWPDAYLDQVMLAVMAHHPSYPKKSDLLCANIILACHSGGGAPMRNIAIRNHRYTANIRECWGFDCLYGEQPETNAWIAWAKSHRSKKLYVYYCDSVGNKDPRKNCTSTKANSLNLKQNRETPSNIIVEKSAVYHLVESSKANYHFWVPLAHWTERIKNTPFLPNR
jgi:hypothetical protein